MAKKKQASKYDEAVEAASKINSLWLEFQKRIRKAWSRDEITSSDEQRFLEIKSEVSRLQRFLGRQLPEGLQYGAEDVNNVMAQSVSIGTVQDLPPADKKGIYVDWHKCYITLQRLMGVLDILREGYPVSFEVREAKTRNVKESRGMTGQKKSKKKTVLLTLIAIAGIILMAWYFIR